jgi:hypothetical protein
MGVVACLVVGRHGERGLVHAGGLAALGQDRVGYGIAGRVCAAMQPEEPDKWHGHGLLHCVDGRG